MAASSSSSLSAVPRRPLYGQVVVGPPGSGKTTFCDGMQQYLRLLGRDAVVINLDPANEAGGGGCRRRKNRGNDTTATTIDATSNREIQGDDDGECEDDENDAEEEVQQLLPYDAIYDVCVEVVNLSSVMEQTGLGPNGGLVYCMEYMEAHVDSILRTIQSRVVAVGNNKNKNNKYLLLDMPGQVELYTHSVCAQRVLHRLAKEMDLRLTAVQLIDAHYCTDATKFLSAALLGTTTMIRLELPAVNVLSKVDLLERQEEAYYGDERLPMQLDYFTECQDLERLVPFAADHHFGATSTAGGDSMMINGDNEDEDDDWDYADDPEYVRVRQRRRGSKFFRKHEALHKAMAEVVEDFGLLSFCPLDISSAESVGRVLARIDKANGYVFTQLDPSSVQGSSSSNNFGGSTNHDDAIHGSSPTTYESLLSEVQERLARPRKR